MSEPNTSDPLHSSCTRAVSVTAGSARSVRIAEHVHRLPADRRQEHFEVAARDELGVHAARFLEQRAAEVRFAATEALGHAGQPPHRLDRRLGDDRRAVREQDAPVRLQASRGDRLVHLRHVDVRLGHGDRGPDVVARRDRVAKDVGHHGAERVHRHDLVRVAPRRERPDRIGGHRVGEVGLVPAQQRARRHRQRPVDAIRAAVRADDVALDAVARAADDRAALARIGAAPLDRQRARRPLDRMRGEADVLGGLGVGAHRCIRKQQLYLDGLARASPAVRAAARRTPARLQSHRAGGPHS